MATHTKKRVSVPFPPATHSSTVVKPFSQKCARTSAPRKSLDAEEDETDRMRVQQEREIRKRDEIQVLKEFSAENHPYSTRLCQEYVKLQSTPLLQPSEICNTTLLHGKISFDVNLSRSNGYGCCVWSFKLGGGVGDHLSPVALRCTNQISHYQVDDMGFVSAYFWKVIGNDIQDCSTDVLPSLIDIFRGVIDMLQGPFIRRSNKEGERPGDMHGDGYSSEEHQERWEVAQREAEAKMARRLAYRARALLPALVGDLDSKDVDSCGALGKWPDRSWLAPSFLEIIAALGVLSEPVSSAALTASAEETLRSLITQDSPRIFSFDLFTLPFCDDLLRELDNYEASGLPQRRPNTMNNYGVIVNDIGMQALMDGLLELLEPVARRLFATEPVVCGLDHHHSFVVQYKSDHLRGDRGLDMHHDASEVTMNVCLGRENFRGGDLLFCGMADEGAHRRYQYSHKHVRGRAVMHLGRHRHGAEDILPAQQVSASAGPGDVAGTDEGSSEGSNAGGAGVVNSERLNLIMWLRSSVFRSAAAYGHISPDAFPKAKEDGVPDICCLSKYNDTDYHNFVPKI